VLLLRNVENLGFARANNQALSIAGGRYVLLLNSDAVLLPGTIHTMATYLDSHPAVGIVGGQILNPDGTFQSSYADFPSMCGELLLSVRLAQQLRRPTYPWHPPQESRVATEADWLSGACLMVRKSAVDVVGRLDEDYFMYTEETDWCYRMKQAGWGVHYVPEARTIHWGGRSAANASVERRTQVYRSKYLFFRKHRALTASLTFRCILAGVSALKLVGWTLASVTANSVQRSRAKHQAQSYVLLLNRL